MSIGDKIISKNKICTLFDTKSSAKIVFTNGCFDLIHMGHLSYLSAAKKLGDILVVGVNSDSSVKKLKGNHRPIKDEITRLHLLASLMYVDYVILFDEETPIDLITTMKPDILVKGGDYDVETIVGYDVVKSNGGEVLTLPFVSGQSTTGLINKIKEI